MCDNTSLSKNGQSSRHAPIAGSDRTVAAGAKKVGPADPNQPISVTVQLRRRSSVELFHRIEELNKLPPLQRNYVTHEDFEISHGADQGDIEKIQVFANEYNLIVERVNAAAGTVVLSGDVASINNAFGVELHNYQHPDFSYLGHVGAAHIPEHLIDIVTAVLGLDSRPQTSPHFRIHQEETGLKRHSKAEVPFIPYRVAQLYNFPNNINCKDQCIGIIELGGGYNAANLDQYFSEFGISPPSITAVSVDGATNQPSGNANGPDGEVDLDIEVAAAVAPGARLVVYFAPNTDAGFLNAITTAIHDKKNHPTVISISWGGPESSWTTQAMQTMSNAFQDATSLGITVCCAAGDNGSTDGVNDGDFHVDFPASSPFVLACGGTRLMASGDAIVSEVVWNEGASGGATGGGVSDVFSLPGWQTNAHVPPSANPGGRIGRGVPDVAGDADPATGYQVLVDGQKMTIGGTSAVAPLWAGLIAIANQSIGHPVGFINSVLYNTPSQDSVFRDITSGNNDIDGSGQTYPARTGWDACTGLGSPNGRNLIIALNRKSGAR